MSKVTNRGNDTMRRLDRLTSDVEALAKGYEATSQALARNSEDIHKLSKAVGELTTLVKAGQGPGFGELIKLAIAVGALVSMLVGGITYIVSNSQSGALAKMSEDNRLLTYRVEQLEKHASPRINQSANYFQRE